MAKKIVGKNDSAEPKVMQGGELVLKLSQVDASFSNNISRQYPTEEALKASFEDKAFKELVAGIKADGLINPLSVSLPEKEGGLYKLRAGFRRYEAVKRLAGDKWPDATVRVHLVSGSEKKLDLLNIKENIQRKDTSPYQLAKAAFDLRQKHQMTQTEIGAELGKGDAYIGNLVRAIEKLSPEIQAQWAVAYNRDAEGDFVHKQSLIRALSTDRINQYVMLPGGHEAQNKAFAIEQLKLEGMSEEEALAKVGATAGEVTPKGKKKVKKVASVSGKVLAELREEVSEMDYDSDAEEEKYAYRDGALACLDFLMGKAANLRVGKVVFFDPRTYAKAKEAEKEAAKDAKAAAKAKK